MSRSEPVSRAADGGDVEVAAPATGQDPDLLLGPDNVICGSSDSVPTLRVGTEARRTDRHEDRRRCRKSRATRRTMQANRGRDTGPELAAAVGPARSGLRFRVTSPCRSIARRRADIRFTRVGLYVFIDGCFWHGCPEHFVVPKTHDDSGRQSSRQQAPGSGHHSHARGDGPSGSPVLGARRCSRLS